MDEYAATLKMICQMKKGFRLAPKIIELPAGFTLSRVRLQQQKQYVLTLRMKQKMINKYMNTADLFDFLQEQASNASMPVVSVKEVVRKEYRSR